MIDFYLFRLGTWLIVQAVHRLAGIDVTIQRVGLFALSDVYIAFQQSISISLVSNKLQHLVLLLLVFY